MFGAVAFAYVYAMGRQLAGPVCGVVAVMVLFTLDPLLFEHGLRSNNMEAALFLCYCGGVFHFVRWIEGARLARGHAAAAAGYFVLGFMTKFVAAIFLPVVCLAALAWGRVGRDRLRLAWRDWIILALAVVVLVAPWFAYQSTRSGEAFWRILVGTHVYTRFTASLDPGHLHPWHYYLTGTWKEVRDAGTQVVVLLGLARLTVAAVRGESRLARMLLVWGVLPLAAISVGTSKVLHYAYPFWPPIGLAAGYAVASFVRSIDGSTGAVVRVWLDRLHARPVVAWVAKSTSLGRALIAIAIASVALAAWTAVRGPFSVELVGVTYLRNSSVLRPLFIAGLLLSVFGYATTVARVAGLVGLLILIPVRAYTAKIDQVPREDHPIRALRDCMRGVQRSGTSAGSGVLNASGGILYHSYYYYYYYYYYYLWRVGSWTVDQPFSPEDVERRLHTPGGQTPVIVSREGYETLVRRAMPEGAPVPQPAALTDPVDDALRDAMRSGARFDDRVAILRSGPFQSCLPGVLAAGAKPLWPPGGPGRQ